MAVPFSRSLRSLRADGFRYTLIALLTATALLLAWLVWLFNATVTDWESSGEARVFDGESIEALFDRQQLSRIARGQPALFYPDATSSQAAGLNAGDKLDALVTAVERDEHTAGGRVRLVIRRPRNPRTPRPALADGATGRVDIEVAHRTPAALLFKAAGAKTAR